VGTSDLSSKVPTFPREELDMRKIIYWVHTSVDGFVEARTASSTGRGWARS
jgi:hypothetical protein